MDVLVHWYAVAGWVDAGVAAVWVVSDSDFMILGRPSQSC